MDVEKAISSGIPEIDPAGSHKVVSLSWRCEAILGYCPKVGPHLVQVKFRLRCAFLGQQTMGPSIWSMEVVR